MVAQCYDDGVAFVGRKPVKDYDQFQLRLPPGLGDRIATAARKNNRSMNSEIAELLDEWYPKPIPLLDWIEDIEAVLRHKDNMDAEWKFRLIQALEIIRDIFR